MLFECLYPLNCGGAVVVLVIWRRNGFYLYCRKWRCDCPLITTFIWFDDEHEESQKKTLGSASHKKTSFVVKAASTPPVKQGANRPLWFASSQSLTYLDGSLPGDYGFDPLGLSDPEGTGGFIEPRWLAYGEIINVLADPVNNNVLTSLKFH
ncbi:unnamed protein product [Arabidopsis arenosa]|uniref:Chlorophyll a-b binding protein, chloroplastic n=1 Tax=Arabidopsis arenosa TaxID=38785 RepID=A0A8S2ANM7_ARAAE|nr:unnamed protein product [Arabidopsis arenosa]